MELGRAPRSHWSRIAGKLKGTHFTVISQPHARKIRHSGGGASRIVRSPCTLYKNGARKGAVCAQNDCPSFEPIFHATSVSAAMTDLMADPVASEHYFSVGVSSWPFARIIFETIPMGAPLRVGRATTVTWSPG